MAGEIIHHILLGIDIGIRIISMSMSILLIIRSVAGRFLPVLLDVYMEPLVTFTDTVVFPVRDLLPVRLVRQDYDYSPLAAAVLILLIGLGAEQLLGYIDEYCQVLH